MRIISIILLFALLIFSGCSSSFKRNSDFQSDYAQYQKEVKKVVVTRTKKRIAAKKSKKVLAKKQKRVKQTKKIVKANKKYKKIAKKRSHIAKMRKIAKTKKTKRIIEKSNVAKTDRKMASKEVKKSKKIASSKKVTHYSKKRISAKKSHRKKVIKLTATAYTSHKKQTDSTPFLAAWNNKIRPGMKIIAVSRDLIKKHGLKNGARVRIKGLKGHYVVRDKMNKRYKKRIDIYMGLNKKKALKWGKRRVVLVVE
jgi:3D (Asp-Asp-Asp) domain-containing protein